MSALGSVGSDDDPSSHPDGSAAVSILLVDDNSAKRAALAAALLPLGHEIVEADSGFAALRLLLTRDFAVILLDVRMPIMDGFETAALIRKRQQSAFTPIIFITAYGRDEITATDFTAGRTVAFLYAPVLPDELRATVETFAYPPRDDAPAPISSTSH